MLLHCSRPRKHRLLQIALWRGTREKLHHSQNFLHILAENHRSQTHHRHMPRTCYQNITTLMHYIWEIATLSHRARISNARGESDTIRKVTVSVPDFHAGPRQRQPTLGQDNTSQLHRIIHDVRFSNLALPALKSEYIQSDQTHLHAYSPTLLCQFRP